MILFNQTPITPSKVVCIGRNYADHIAELNNEIPTTPVIFAKPNSSISSKLVSSNEQIDYESEITFLLSEKKIIGVGIGLDLTKRQVQNQLKEKGLPWERAKAFDGSAVVSHFIAYDGDGSDLTMSLWINGELKQQANYELMMLKPLQIIDEVSSFMSFQENDLLMTGTPKGVGQIQRGDRFEAKLYQNDNVLVKHHWVVE